MELYFIRHAQPAWVRDERSVMDPGLTELGRRQAERLAEVFAEFGDDGRYPTELLVSPTQRTRETAAPLAAKLGLTPEVIPFFEEVRLPDWSKTPVAEVARIIRQSRQRSYSEWWGGLPGGEDLRAFRDRLTGGLSELMSARSARLVDAEGALWHLDRPDQRLIFIGHGGSNSVALTFLLGLPPVPWEWERFAARHASITFLKTRRIAGSAIFSLRQFSSVGHLGAELHTH